MYIGASIATHGTITLESGVFDYQTAALHEDGAAGTQAATPTACSVAAFDMESFYVGVANREVPGTFHGKGASGLAANPQ